MKKAWAQKQTGFTIVELLIVIVVIAILAAVSIVAYNGVQSRARDSARTSGIRDIQKSLELYRATHDRYPPHTAIGSNIPSGFSPRYGTSYAYSVDTAGNWLKSLTDSDVVDTVPVDPINNNDHYYIYWASGPNGYGACTEPFYVLFVFAYESVDSVPSDSERLNCSDATHGANWSLNPPTAIFSNTTTP